VKAALRLARARLVSADEPSTPTSRLESPCPSANGISSERVVVDPSKGGAVSPKAAQQSKALDVEPGYWVWGGVVKVLEVDLFSAAWEVRHGAAMALRELLKAQGKCGGMKGKVIERCSRRKAHGALITDDASPEDNETEHERWCNHLAARLLCVFVLDRFGDFVSDQVRSLHQSSNHTRLTDSQVVAPVRETVSQTLASLLLHMPRRSVSHVHSILLQMIRQEFPVPGKSDTEKAHVWEVRHAGLLGIKYEVAVRSDLFQKDDAQMEVEGADTETGGKAVLRGVVDAAVLGSVVVRSLALCTLIIHFQYSLGDRDDDVRSVAATCLLPVAAQLVDQLPEELERVLVVLWSCLRDMRDDLSSSVGAVMDLLGVYNASYLVDARLIRSVRKTRNIQRCHQHHR
jgi:TATA-binding protein-associated factor